MLYRTEDLARWGAGKGSNLLPVEIDANNWEIAGRLQAVEAAAGATANGIANVTVIGSQMTVYLSDGTPLGPYTLPTAMIRYRGDWATSTAYGEMDLVAVTGVGLYLVLADHSSDASGFDALAEDGAGNPLYRYLFPMGAGGGGTGASVSDEGSQIVAAPTDLNFAGAGVSVTDDNDGSVTVTIPGLGSIALGDLADVTITTPASGQFLRYDGSAFVNAAVGWSDVTGKPATFTPAAHGHPAAEVAGAVIEEIAGTTYTAVAADRAKWKRTSDASAVTITIDANVLGPADEITFEQGGPGQITFVAGAGMVLNARGGALKSAGQHAVCGVKFVSGTQATLFGDITA